MTSTDFRARNLKSLEATWHFRYPAETQKAGCYDMFIPKKLDGVHFRKILKLLPRMKQISLERVANILPTSSIVVLFGQLAL